MDENDVLFPWLVAKRTNSVAERGIFFFFRFFYKDETNKLLNPEYFTYTRNKF